MNLLSKAKEFLEGRRYGPLVRIYHFPSDTEATAQISGPIDPSKKQMLLAEKVDLSGIVHSSILSEGQIRNHSIGRLKAANVMDYRKIAAAYLDGTFTIKSPTPLNSQMFILPLNRYAINRAINLVDNLQDPILAGTVYLDVLETGHTVPVYDSYNFSSPGWDNGYYLENRRTLLSGVSENPRKDTIQYLSDLPLWELNLYDYSDKLRISIEEHEKKTKQGKKHTFFVSRLWSKTPHYGTGVERSTIHGREEIIISGLLK